MEQRPGWAPEEIDISGPSVAPEASALEKVLRRPGSPHVGPPTHPRTHAAIADLCAAAPLLATRLRR